MRIGPGFAASVPYAMSRALAALCIVLVCSMPANAQRAEYSAEAVKAAYLYHFGGYVQWPGGQKTDEGITIGVIGADEVLAQLRTLLPGRTLQNRPVSARAVTARDSLEGIHILYIGKAGPARPERLIKSALDKSVLVITDRPQGLDHGGMINFVIADRRVRFEISPKAAEKAGLKLSSRLLAIALRVHSSGLFNGSTPVVFLKDEHVQGNG